MNASITMLNQAGASFVAHAGSMLVQAGVLILVLWILDRALRRHLRASLRYGLWMLVLVKLVLSPQFSLPTGVGNWAGHLSAGSGPLLPAYLAPSHSTVKAKPHRRAAVLPKVADPGVDSTGSITVSGNEVAEVPVRLGWPGMILAGWLVGVSVLGSVLLIRARSLRRIIRDAEPAGEAMVDLLARCRREVRLTAYVQLKLTRDLSGPAVCRAWRPVILVPQALTDGLPEDQQRAILIHELCHIKRLDPWVNLAQTLLQVFYFYNPLVWLANTSIRRVREQAVDERVLVCLQGQQFGPEALDGLQCYSHALIDIASAMTLRARLGMGLIGVSESKTRLNERIELMLYRPTPKNAGLGIMGLAALIALGCTLLPMATAGGAANAPAGAFAPADAQTSEKLLKDIQTAADQMAAAFNAKQMDSLMSHYAPDLIVMTPGEPALVGAEAQRKAHAKAFGEGVQIRSVKLPQHRIVICGDLIYMGGLYSYTMAAPDGSSTNTDARCGVMIAQRQKDGMLKLKLEAYNRIASAQASDPVTPEVIQCTADSPTLPANAKLYDQIRDLDRQFEKMFTDNRPMDALGQYTDDAVLMANGGQIFQGRDALKTLFEQKGDPVPVRDVELKFAHVEGNDQMVYLVKWCGWKLKNPVSGMDYVIPGKSFHIWRHQPDGSWKIVFDLNNVDLSL
jgi:beta-lactamase regulating signal transducer with metallopeptidase domain/ketosteroid isomerase-like protein